MQSPLVIGISIAGFVVVGAVGSLMWSLRRASTLQIYNTLMKYPFGNFMFSLVFCLYAPYSFSIRPSVQEMKPGFASVTMSQSWFVQNHIRTVHAIAICNLIEITMAIVTEASLPSHLRWLPVGMDVNYLKKATGKLEATSTIDPATHFKLAAYPGEVKIPIEVKNRSGELVTKAEIRIWVSEKPERKKKE